MFALAGSAEEKCARDAAITIGNLAVVTRNQVAVTEAGGLPPLVAMLSSNPYVSCQKFAARALYRLAAHGDNKPKILGEGALPPLVRQLRSLDAEVARWVGGWGLGRSIDVVIRKTIRNSQTIIVRKLKDGAHSVPQKGKQKKTAMNRRFEMSAWARLVVQTDATIGVALFFLSLLLALGIWGSSPEEPPNVVGIPLVLHNVFSLTPRPWNSSSGCTFISYQSELVGYIYRSSFEVWSLRFVLVHSFRV